jgi:hypothetical protein
LPEFRVVMASTALTGFGFVGESVVLGWFLLDETDSAFVVGIGVALRMLPNLIFGLVAGGVADSIDRRLLIRGLGLATAAFALMTAGLAMSGALSVWLLLLLTFGAGVFRTMQQAARQSYVFDVVGPTRVVSGMAAINLCQRSGSVVGALTAGLLLEASGPGPVYLALAASHALSSGVMFMAKTKGESAPATRAAFGEGIRELAGELRRNRTLALLVLLTGAVEVLGFSHQTLMPVIARDFIGVGAAGLGMLNATSSAGGMAAVLMVALRGGIGGRGASFLAVLVLFGLGLTLLGNSNVVLITFAAAVFVSALAALSDVLSQSLIQLAVANEMRGRAMGTWILAIGLGPIGHLQVGAVATALGAAVALSVNGGLLVALAVVVAVVSPRLRRL